MDRTKDRIATNLTFLRRWRGFSQEQVADAIRVSRATYTFYETGRSTPTAERLSAIGELYGIPLTMILNRDFSGCRFSPYESSELDDTDVQLQKYKKLPLISQLLVLERMMTLIEIESSLYQTK